DPLPGLQEGGQNSRSVTFFPDGRKKFTAIRDEFDVLRGFRHCRMRVFHHDNGPYHHYPLEFSAA
ncbi:MAG: hypothetical protein RLZZ436_25, partial [Planctomycetota bacterium]